MQKMTSENIPNKEACTAALRNVLDALYVISGKWKLPIILTLVQSPRRFNEIQHELGSISPKVLSSELKDLELNGFIRRNIFPTQPVSIIYEATDYSATLRNVLHELGAWGKQHRERIRESIRQASVVE
jgi:DNA-binding HxlR family transcriptional regulator